MRAARAKGKEEERKRIAAEQELEKQRAREEADRLERLAEEQRVAKEAQLKKEQALAEAAEVARLQQSKNNSSNDIEELKRMNRELIEENRNLRDQFAEINRKLDIVINNIGVDGAERNVPERRRPFQPKSLKRNQFRSQEHLLRL